MLNKWEMKSDTTLITFEIHLSFTLNIIYITHLILLSISTFQLISMHILIAVLKGFVHVEMLIIAFSVQICCN